MARTGALINKRDKSLVKEYNKLKGIKSPGGKTKYSHEYILELLANKFFLAEFTINRVITKSKINKK